MVQCVNRDKMIVMTLLLAAFSVLGAAPGNDKDNHLTANEQVVEQFLETIETMEVQYPVEAQSDHKPEDLKVVRSGLFAHSRPVTEIASGSQGYIAGSIHQGENRGDLYFREAENDPKITVKPLNNKWYWDIQGAKWSTNEAWLAVKQINDSLVPRIRIDTETADAKRSIPYSRAGQAIQQQQIYVVNRETQKYKAIKHGLQSPLIHIIGWSDDSKQLRFLRSDRFLKKLELVEADIDSGNVNVLLTESDVASLIGLDLLQGHANRLDFRHLPAFLKGNRGFIWTSDRSGYRHLYVYDAKGDLDKSLTKGKFDGWVVRIVDIDHKRGLVYALTAGSKGDPYAQSIYQFSLAGNKPEKIASGPNIIKVLFSANKDRMWALRTSFPNTAQVEEFDIFAKTSKIYWAVDPDIYAQAGFAPELVWVKAADGKTPIRAALFKPNDFDESKSYPVIEEMYPAPYTSVIPQHPLAGKWIDSYLRAQQGYIVVLIDGRGTLGRGTAFQNYSYGRFGQVEIADHVAALNQLAKDRSYMDMSRVGVYGHSWGGYFALRALLQAPQTYHAGIVSAAGVDLKDFRVSIEPFMGCSPAMCPQAYKLAANTALLDKLQAHLLIVHGTADDDVPFVESEKLIKALDKAGKPYELITLPGANHIVWNDELELKEDMFFSKHLQSN
ncbi:S9 family peptidase [Thalassotalea litorea]|nr:prolyl oligopeptidase family serine peptidase [Thalassotalea litorea]